MNRSAVSLLAVNRRAAVALVLGFGIAFWSAPGAAAPNYDPEETAIAAWTNTARLDVRAFCAACRRLDPGYDCAEWGTATDLPPLRYEPRAAEAARFHSKHLGAAPCFQHESCCNLVRLPDGTVGCEAPPCSSCDFPTNCPGTDTFLRYPMLGYGAIAAENLFAGATDSLEAVCGWMDSPGHRSNILDGDLDEIGVGAWRPGGSCIPYLWTQAFGAHNRPPDPGLIPAAGVMPGNPGTPFVANRGDQLALAHVAAEQNVVLVRAVVDGRCVPLVRAFGNDQRGLWTGAFDISSGCHQAWFVATTADGTRGIFPPTGALGFAENTTCPEPATRTPAACEGEDACTVDGARRPCWTGPEGLMGIGACRPGSQSCTDGAWSRCDGEIVPSNERCNGLDDDCDGTVDESPSDVGESCTSGWAGPCAAGITTCAGGRLVCERSLDPTSEQCNGFDDDCDGTVDDGFGETTCGTGACLRLSATCRDGSEVACVPGLPTGNETCGNGLDDDCDGSADEGCACTGNPRACWTGATSVLNKGACRAGVQACVNGTWGECTGAIVPVPESCNGVDDDCDGAVDEEQGREACGEGACRVSVGRCVSGAVRVCEPLDAELERCDGTDDDCDGEVDEGCACPPGLTERCYPGDWNQAGVGTCVEGTSACKPDGTGFSACEGFVLPVSEACANELDDDCDGETDEADCTGAPDAGNEPEPPPEGCQCSAGTNALWAALGLLRRRRARN